VSLVELNAWEDEICYFKNFIPKKNEKKVIKKEKKK
jgi:hypothetical protein